MSDQLTEALAQDVVQAALDRGATDAECILAQGDEFTVNLRMREVESLKEAGSRGAGLRVMVGHRTGSAYTSDLTDAGIRGMVDSALALAEITTEDPHAGLPEPEELGALDGDLGLFCADVAKTPSEQKIRMARETEEAALSHDPRIVNSEGAAFDSYEMHHVFANSRGFQGSYRSSHCSQSVAPVAKDGDSMERDSWFSVSRSIAGLADPAEVGRRAAQRALRRLHARKVGTQKVPVVFEARVAKSLLGHLFGAVSGESVYQQASYLAGKLGEKVASEKLTVVDDGTIPGLFGTSPFDDEGVPRRRTTIVEKGVLKSYLLNTYTARKLGMKTTGSASRGISGNTSVGHANLFAEKGERSPEDLIGAVTNGFYVTELLGFGVNVVTGDYSRGAVGIWIENGKLSYPVHEVTIAGNLRQMLEGVEMVGNDLEFQGATACPTLLIGQMTVSGQ